MVKVCVLVLISCFYTISLFLPWSFPRRAVFHWVFKDTNSICQLDLLFRNVVVWHQRVFNKIKNVSCINLFMINIIKGLHMCMTTSQLILVKLSTSLFHAKTYFSIWTIQPLDIPESAYNDLYLFSIFTLEIISIKIFDRIKN